MSIFAPDKIVIPTDGLTFGAQPPMTYVIDLQMFQDQIGADPSFVLAGDVPFSYALDTTSKPRIVLTFDKAIGNIVIGKEYALTVNGPQNAIKIVFAYTDSYREYDWFMSDPEERAGSSFAFKEVQHGTQIVSQVLNTKLRMLFGFVASVNFQLTDYLKRRETKKRLRDIVDAAVSGVGFPKNCRATVTRETDGRIAQVDLTYAEGEEALTRITYTYIDGQISYAFDDPTLAAIPNLTKPFLSRISVDRMAPSGDTKSVRYNVCAVQFTRALVSYPTLFGCTVTMPSIISWDVIE